MKRLRALLDKIKKSVLPTTPFGMVFAIAVVVLFSTFPLFVWQHFNPFRGQASFLYREAVTLNPVWENHHFLLKKPWNQRQRVADLTGAYLEGSPGLRLFFPGPARLSDVRRAADGWVILLKSSGETALPPESLALLARDLVATLHRGPLSGHKIQVFWNGEFVPFI